MRVAIAALCVGAVAFLLGVLVAFLKEWMSSTNHTAKFYLSKFNPSRPPGEVIVMDSRDRKQEVRTKTDERIAI
jgi:hypothetical protein